MLATDHAPHSAADKALPLWDAPAGLTGVETFVSLMLNEVNKGSLSLNDFVRLSSEAPAKTWGIYPQKGSLQTGTDADFTIVDMNGRKKINANALHSKSKTSPYDGVEVQGIPVATVVRGKFVMKNGELTGNRGYGSLVTTLVIK
jgi:dihydroorotase-like cyclic amidohydrolase